MASVLFSICISSVFLLRSVSFKMFWVWLKHRLVFFSEVHSLNRVFFSPVPECSNVNFICWLELWPPTAAWERQKDSQSQSPQKVSRMLPLSLTLVLEACKHWTQHSQPCHSQHCILLDHRKTQKAMHLICKIQSVEEKHGCEWKDSRDDAWSDAVLLDQDPCVDFEAEKKKKNHCQERNSASPMKCDSSNLPKLELPYNATSHQLTQLLCPLAVSTPLLFCLEPWERDVDVP